MNPALDGVYSVLGLLVTWLLPWHRASPPWHRVRAARPDVGSVEFALTGIPLLVGTIVIVMSDRPAASPMIGQQAYPGTAESGTSGPSWRPDPGRAYPVTIEALVRSSWKDLAEFRWWTPQADTLGRYIAHRNR